MSVGEYEASLRERAVAARRRLFGSPVTSTHSKVAAVEHDADPEPDPGYLTTRQTKAIIRDLIIMGEAPGPFRWRHIVEEVIEKHGVTFGQIIGRQRSKPLCVARFEAYFRLSEETTLSLPQIGKIMGGKDHTSVLYGIRKFRERNGLAA
jgi:chromosomal replication initiation ATPase DnaA